MNLKAKPDITIRQHVTNIKSGKIRAEDFLSESLKRIEQNADLNAFISLFAEDAVQRARRIDEKQKGGKKTGILAGTIIAIKDNLNLRHKPTTCASKILSGYISPYTVTVLEKLLAEDAILIGKTNMDEFAMGSSTENSFYGVSKNPYDKKRVPGGSSGGSAVAVAAGTVHAALGSDTGGSIRQPAAFSGVVGLKPSYGRVSRYGLIAFASSLDQIGTFNTNVDDAALMLQVISGKDKMDATSADIEVPDYSSELEKDIRGMRIAICDAYMGEGLNPEIRAHINATLTELERAGAELCKVSLPHTKYGIATYYIIATAEASSNLARYDGIKYGHRTETVEGLDDTYNNTRFEGFGEEVRRRIMLGTYVLSSGYYDAYYKKAQQLRRLIKQDFDRAFAETDCIISPVTPTTAFKIGEKIDDPLNMYLSDIYTVGANLAGNCAVSVPAGSDSNGLPLGVQIIAPAFAEAKLLRCARFIEKIVEKGDMGGEGA